MGHLIFGLLVAKPMDLPHLPSLPLFSAASVRAKDQEAIVRLEGRGIELMERAGKAAFKVIQSLRPDASTLSAIAGRGNNGGDAYIVARLAREAGWDVRLFPSDPDVIPNGDAGLARERYLAAGGPILDFIPEDFEGAEILVDGLFGTGLDRSVEGIDAAIIAAANRYRERGLHHQTNRRTVIALDIPSGLDANRGAVLGAAVQADHTITFVSAKPGLFTGMGPSLSGTVHLSTLEIDADILNGDTPRATLTGWPSDPPLPRPRDAHKGCFGHVLVIGGAPGYSGAARLAGEAALRTGAGLVSIATHQDHAALLNIGRPELMVKGSGVPEDIESLFHAATVVAVGPGLGQSPWGQDLLNRALTFEGPLVVDADGLNLLAQAPIARSNWILTPHPGEAGRLLGISKDAVQADRLKAAEQLAERFGATIILKGAGSIVASPKAISRIIPLGNPGMASGGMGDTLTGIVAALFAQGLDGWSAASFGALLHAAAADHLAEQYGERGLLALDLPPTVRTLLDDPSLLKVPSWPCLLP
jgi:ADP-dependent NAD(P)H-hydrate dehydratase / NAD(P)H-hydrate epimerase